MKSRLFITECAGCIFWQLSLKRLYYDKRRCFITSYSTSKQYKKWLPIFVIRTGLPIPGGEGIHPPIREVRGYIPPNKGGEGIHPPNKGGEGIHPPNKGGEGIHPPQ